jgi:hypothetical protein
MDSPSRRARFPDIRAFLLTLRGYPDEVVEAAAVAAASRIAELERELEEARKPKKSVVHILAAIPQPWRNIIVEFRERAECAEAALLALHEKIGDVQGMGSCIWHKLDWMGLHVASKQADQLATALRNHLLGEKP